MRSLPLAVTPAWPRPRFVPVTDDAMEPTLRMGQVLAVVPLDRYRGPGLYLVTDGAGARVVRVQPAGGGGLRLTADNCRAASSAISQDRLEAALLGQAAGVVRVLDHALLGL